MSKRSSARRRLWHGGAPGLNVGDLIKPGPPHVVDGCAICTARAAGRTYVDPVFGQVDPPTGRPDRVYLTTDRDYARYYAAQYPHGTLYVVKALGKLDRSTEDSFPTWCAPKARVTRVAETDVVLTWPERTSMFRRWTAADNAAAFTLARHLEMGAP